LYIGPSYDLLLPSLERALQDENTLRLTPLYHTSFVSEERMKVFITSPAVTEWYECDSSTLQLLKSEKMFMEGEKRSLLPEEKL
jgi:hypothetical protein